MNGGFLCFMIKGDRLVLVAELSQKQRTLLNAQKNGIPVTRLEFNENNELSNFDELSEGAQNWIANG